MLRKFLENYFQVKIKNKNKKTDGMTSFRVFKTKSSYKEGKYAIKFKVLLDTNSIFQQHGRQQTSINKMDNIGEKFHQNI